MPRSWSYCSLCVCSLRTCRPNDSGGELGVRHLQRATSCSYTVGAIPAVALVRRGSRQSILQREGQRKQQARGSDGGGGAQPPAPARRAGCLPEYIARLRRPAYVIYGQGGLSRA